MADWHDDDADNNHAVDAAVDDVDEAAVAEAAAAATALLTADTILGDGAGGDAGPNSATQAVPRACALGSDLVLRQSPLPIEPSTDPLVLLLEASSAAAALDLALLSETVTRLLTFAQAAGRRVTVLVYNDAVIALHPSQACEVALMSCSVQSSDPPRACAKLHALPSELRSIVNVPLAAERIAPLVQQYINVVKSGVPGGGRAPSTAAQTRGAWLAATVRLATVLLSTSLTRGHHMQIVAVAASGNVWQADAANRIEHDAAATAAEIARAVAALPCSVSVSAVALGAAARLDVLGGITTVFDGLLGYAATLTEAGAALAELARFLTARPYAMMLPVSPQSVAAASVPLPDAALVAVRAAYSAAQGAKFTAALAEDAGDASVDRSDTAAASGTWLCGRPGGVVLSACLDVDGGTSSVVDAIAADDVEATTSVARSVAMTTDTVRVSWPEARVTGAHVQASRHVFVAALQTATQPWLRRLRVPVALAEAWDGMAEGQDAVAQRRAFEVAFQQWCSSDRARAARYTCAVLRGDDSAVQPVGVPLWLADRAPEDARWLWRPQQGRDDGLRRAAAVAVRPLSVTPPQPHALLGLATDEAARSYLPYTLHERDVTTTEYEARQARIAAAAVAAKLDLPPLLLPLVLRLEDACDPYASCLVERKLAAILYDDEERWGNPLLATQVYGGLLGDWVDAAARGTVDVPHGAASVPPLTVADVARSLALTAESAAVGDMFARFVRGDGGGGGGGKAGAAPEAAAGAITDEAGAAATAAAQTYWRSPEAAPSLAALGAVLALYRNTREYTRARVAAVDAYARRELAARHAETARSVDAEVAARLESTILARGRGRPSGKEAKAWTKVIRRALLAERAATAAATEGAQLDADAERAALMKTVAATMPPGVNVAAQLRPADYKIVRFEEEALPALHAAALDRGETAEYAGRLCALLKVLFEAADSLITSVPANAATTCALADALCHGAVTAPWKP